MKPSVSSISIIENTFTCSATFALKYAFWPKEYKALIKQTRTELARVLFAYEHNFMCGTWWQTTVDRKHGSYIA